MKRLFTTGCFVAILTILLGACNFGLTPPPLSDTPATNAPGSTEVAVATSDVVVPIDLAGPPMEVGSKYTYVDGSVLVAVPAGPFLMGNSNVSETPERTVTLSDYWIYSSEVTNGQFAFCVNAGKCAAPDQEKNPAFGNYRFINKPVTGVNYQQAFDYCNFVKGRLPTEAEWEKAARGPEGNLFPWGDNAPVCDLLNFDFCKGETLNIQSYPEGVSYYGAFDLAGNVREWVADWFSTTYYTDGPLEDPLGPQLGDKRSVRSSSYEDGSDESFASHRFSLKPQEDLADLGFRCVVEDPTQLAPLCTQLAYYGSGLDGAESNCTPSVLCNDVSIGLGQDCQGEVGSTIVTFNLSGTPPNDWTYGVSGGSCADLGGTATTYQYKCTSGATAEVTGACIDGASCDPVCPAHYTLDGDSCVWDGSGTVGTDCIEGLTYDPVNQCCSATPGSGINFDICPAGYYPFNGGCIKDPGKNVDSEIKAVNIPVCTDNQPECNPDTDPDCPPPDDGGGCRQPVTCDYPYAPNPDGCSCYCTWGPGKCANYSP